MMENQTANLTEIGHGRDPKTPLGRHQYAPWRIFDNIVQLDGWSGG
jgi:hypothetical protein